MHWSILSKLVMIMIFRVLAVSEEKKTGSHQHKGVARLQSILLAIIEARHTFSVAISWFPR